MYAIVYMCGYYFKDINEYPIPSKQGCPNENKWSFVFNKNINTRVAKFHWSLISGKWARYGHNLNTNNLFVDVPFTTTYNNI